MNHAESPPASGEVNSYPRGVEAPKEQQLAVGCECGFEVRGSADEMVPALQKHAGESHNMKVTREQVLARARPI